MQNFLESRINNLTVKNIIQIDNYVEVGNIPIELRWLGNSWFSLIVKPIHVCAINFVHKIVSFLSISA